MRTPWIGRRKTGRPGRWIIALLALGASCAPAGPAAAPARVASAPPPGACETPVSQRAQEVGCYLTAIHPLGELPDGPLFWHLDRYPTRAAAEAARGPRGIVVEAFGRVILYTIAEQGWRPAGGERLAAIGPLPHDGGRPYTARYMEGVFEPGMRTTAHRHSGAEAWYMVEGAQCLETPAGITVIHAGQSAMVEAGPPMVLNHVGRTIRRSVLLVLHPSEQPWITRTPEWVPPGRCPE